MKKVLNESKAGSAAQDFLQEKHKENIEQNKIIEEELKKEEGELLNKKKILDKGEYKKLSDVLRTKVKDYQLKRASQIEILNKQRSESRKTLLKTLQPILSDYAKENNVSMILDKKDIILGKTDNDITTIIIEKLNKKLPSLDLK